MKITKVIAAVAAILVAGSLAACSSGGSGGGASGQSCTNKIMKKDAPVVTMWAWYPNMKLVVDNFNKAHDDVQVCWTNAGAGGDEYDKFQTAITAGKGAPDVVMVEADRIPTYQIQDALVDMSSTAPTTSRPTSAREPGRTSRSATGVYGAPIDGGPMGMIYRKDVFDKYKITPPTTWAEYAAAAQKVKDAGGPLFGDLAANQPAAMVALEVQNGAQPFTYDPSQKNVIGIKLNDDSRSRCWTTGPVSRRRASSASRTSSPRSTSPASSAVTTRPSSRLPGLLATCRVPASARVQTPRYGRRHLSRSGTRATRSR